MTKAIKATTTTPERERVKTEALGLLQESGCRAALEHIIQTARHVPRVFGLRAPWVEDQACRHKLIGTLADDVRRFIRGL